MEWDDAYGACCELAALVEECGLDAQTVARSFDALGVPGWMRAAFAAPERDPARHTAVFAALRAVGAWRALRISRFAGRARAGPERGCGGAGDVGRCDVGCVQLVLHGPAAAAAGRHGRAVRAHGGVGDACVDAGDGGAGRDDGRRGGQRDAVRATVIAHVLF